MIYTKEETNTKYLDITNLNNLDGFETGEVISLFSGAGGLDIGLEQAGFSTALCIENDADCRETLKYNRPNWKLFESPIKVESGKMIQREPGDIRNIEVNEIIEHGELLGKSVDLVVGGAPCQPFSNIGKKKGKYDEKNGDLFLEFVRVVKGIKPKAFIFENVAGITQGRHTEVIEYMCDNFKGLGYGISYSILNAADYGVPQRRERFFLIGIQGVDKPAFPLPTHFRSKESWGKFLDKLDATPNYLPKKWKSVNDVFSKISKSSFQRPDYAIMNISEKVKKRMRLIEQGENFKVLPMELRPNCWKNGKHQGQDTFGRLVDDLPSVTIRTAAYNPSKGRYIHPSENRGLSTIEMAALQDFPKDWIFRSRGRDKITLVSGGRQIGNAVPPGLARALGVSIKAQLAMVNEEFHKKQKLPAL